VSGLWLPRNDGISVGRGRCDARRCRSAYLPVLRAKSFVVSAAGTPMEPYLEFGFSGILKNDGFRNFCCQALACVSGIDLRG
jgi:hypothetical protein